MSVSTILNLPWNILLNIIQNLSLSDIKNLMLTCRCLHDFVINENVLWRSLNRNKIIIHKTVKAPLYQQCRVSHNWINGYYCKKILITHRINYMPWLKYHNADVLLLSVGSELRCYPTNRHGFPICRDTLWKVNVPTVTRNDVRTNDISRFITKNNCLACANRDGTVAVYRMDSIRRTPHLVRHINDCHSNGQVEVSAVELITIGEKERVITASECSTRIGLWDVQLKDNGRICYDLSEDVRMIEVPDCTGVRCIATNQTELLALGPNGNSKPILLDITSGQILIGADKSVDVKDVVRDIIWHDPNSITCVTHSGLLQTLDIRTGKVIHSVWDPFRASLYCVRSDGDRALVVGASQYSRCVLFDLRTSTKHLQLYFTQKKASPVYCLDFDSRKLIAAADRSIAALDFDVYLSEAEHFDYSNAFV